MTNWSNRAFLCLVTKAPNYHERGKIVPAAKVLPLNPLRQKKVPEILRIHQQQVFTKKVLRLSFWDSRDVQRLRNACSKTLANSQFHFSEVFWSAEIQTWDCMVRSINATSVLSCTPKILEIKPAEVT